MAKQKINAYQNGSWYEELARVTVTSNTNTMSVSFTPKKFMRILIVLVPTGGAVTISGRFNGDSGSSYGYRTSDSGGAENAAGTQNAFYIDTSGTNSLQFTVTNFLNLATQEKLLYTQGVGNNAAGVANAPARREMVNKWVNTSVQANSMVLTNAGGGNYAPGTELIILGHD